MRIDTVNTTIETARTSASKIQKLISRTAVSLGADVAGWGQFVDDERDAQQTGIYGTAAAVELLTLAQASESTGPLPLARAVIGPGEHAAQNRLFNDPEDPFITHKLAAMVEGATFSSEDSLPQVAEALVGAMAAGGGWANYLGHGVAPPGPEVLPTAVVLYALRRHQVFRVMPECRIAVGWLARELAADAEIPTAVAAMAVLALVQYGALSDSIVELGPAVAAATSRLARWATRRPTATIGEHYEFHYAVRTDARSFNQYIFLLPDCIAALVFLNDSEPRRLVRPYLRRVARSLSANTLRADGFRSPNSLRKGTVDQLWVFRVMDQVAHLQPRSLKGLDYTRPLRISRRQLTVGAALVVATVGFGAVSLSHAHLWLRALALVGDAVLTGALGTFVAAAIRGDQ